MGKSSKKSATKVEAVVPAGKALKNGNKREAEESPAKVVSAKKMKTNEGVKQAIVKEKVEKKTQKKKQESSSSEEESSEEEEEVKPAKQNGKQAPKKVETKVQKKQESSSSEEESSEEDSEDEEPAKKPQAVAAPAKKAESSEESDDSSSEEEDDTPVPAKAPVAVTKKKADSSEDESDESSSEEDEPTPAAKKAPVAAAQKKPDSSSDEDSDESSDDEPAAPAAKAVPVKVSQKKAESSDDDSDDSSSEDDKKTAKVVAAPKKMDVDGSDDDSSEESDESGSEEESEDDKTTKTPKKTAADTVMVDAVTPKSTKQSDFKKTPNTPATPENAGSKTLFVGNLPFDIERADVERFFKDCGEVVDVRFSMNEDQRPKGFGHVEFATVEAAQKAIELNGQMLGGRDVRLDFARERGARPAYSGNEGNSFQKGGYGGESKRLFVRGFDTSSGEDEIRNQLTEYFGKCGEVANISIPADYETGAVKGMAYVEFSDADAISKALELNGSDYTVEEARPRNRDGGGGRSGGRGDGYSGGGGRRGGGGRFGSGGGGRFGSGGGGRFGSGGRGDSGGRGRGRGFGGGRGGRGTPRPSSFAMASGKKTTFDD